MGKETVRYPDALVARIEELVADSEVFESKSELHRFASDFLCCVLDPEHEPSVLGYDDIRDDLEAESGVSLQPDDVATGDGDVPFLHSYLTVRRSLLHGDVREARAYVDETYDIADREALLLDELIGRYRTREPGPQAPSRTVQPPATNRQGDKSVGTGGQPRTNGDSPPSDTADRDRESTRPAADGSGSPTDGRIDSDAAGSEDDTKDVTDQHVSDRSR